MDNIAKINKIIKTLESNSLNNNLEKVLEKYEWPPEIFFITLVSQIINELTNIENKSKEKDLLNYNTSFLFKMINLFCNVKYHHAITKQILNYIITKENIDLIFEKIITINNSKDENTPKEKFEDFNNNIVNLLITIMNFDNKGIIDIIVNNNNSQNLLNDLFNIFSENEYCRNFLYNLEKNFGIYYPNIKSFKENMNYTIYFLTQNLDNNIEYYFKIKEEINIILLIYKNDIEIINDSMKMLLMYVFREYEKKEENYKDSLTSLIKNCLNNIIFSEKDKKNNNNKDNKIEYNYKFMNFLLNIYNQLIKEKLTKSYTLLFSQLFLSLDQQQLGAKKYKWLLKNTQFKIVLKSLMNLKDENLLTLYFTKIMTLSAPNNSKNKEDYYLPDEDIYFFITNFDNIIKDGNDDNNEYILNIICSMIINLINMNKVVINTILNRYKILDVIIPFITCDKYNINIRAKIINLLEEILKLNNFNYKYQIKLNIQKDINEINIKLNLISLLYENDEKQLEKKISEIINNMLIFLNNNDFKSFFVFIEIILKYIINKIINQIHLINNDIISKFNNIFVNASEKIIGNKDINNNKNNIDIKDDKEISNFEIKKKLIKYLLQIVYELNMNYFRNKIIKKKIMDKIIISENTIFTVVKNILSGKYKNELLHYIINDLCTEKTNIENIENNNINNDIIKEEDDKNICHLLKSSKLIYMINIILLDNKDEEGIIILYNKLEEIINYSEINIKILLNFDIISIMLKTLLFFDNKELYEKIKIILSKISKYLDEKSLINYISKLFCITYEALINEEMNNIKKKEAVIDLFNILKIGIITSKKTNYNYLSISKKGLSNPYIYNLFYITGLFKKNKIINYSANIRIHNNNLINFNLATFVNSNTSSMLSFIINNNQLIISEIQNKKEKNIIKTIQNLNSYLPYDKNFHNISIKLNFFTHTIKILIDSVEIKDDKDKISLENNFSLENFDIIIGYDFENKKVKDNNKSDLSDIALIDVSKILILNYDNEEDNDMINRQKLKLNKDYELTDSYIKDKNSVIGELILAEFNLKNSNINYINSDKLKTISKYSFLNNISNKYNGTINYKNPFISNESKDNKININLFMLSSNDNIEEFISLNNILCGNYISKNIIKSLISKNYEFWFNACNYCFVDFLIGFLYIFERKRKNNRLSQENEKNENNIDNKDNIVEDNYINDIIIIIFEIIFEIQNRNILNYFLYNSDIINIKIKQFFGRNIEILNNKIFVEKLLSLLKMTKMSELLELQNNSHQEYLLNIITKIFFHLIIFKKLNDEIQNLIIIKLYSIINTITSKNNNNINYILYELLINIYNIILFYELSDDAIETENNKTKLDILLQCIEKIYNIYKSDYKYLLLENNNTFYDKIIEQNEDIIILSSEYDSNLQSHHVNQFIQQNKSILSDNFLSNNLIKNQIEKLSSCLKKLNKNEEERGDRFSLELTRTTNINFNLNQNIEKNNDSIDKIVKKCSFCIYLNNYFKIYFTFIYDNIKFDKYYNKFYRNIFLNFNEFRNIVQNENNMFAWYLSSKESSYRIQNKFFLKENDIKRVERKNNNYLYMYDYDINQYHNIIKNFHRIFIYDSISIDSHFISKIYEDINKKIFGNISENIFNCLYVKRINKTLSLLLLNKDYILLFNNLFIDLNDNIQVVKTELDKIIMYLKKQEFKQNLENYVKNNSSNIIKELFYENENNINLVKKKTESRKFGLVQSYKFSIKKIYYKQISEMHKVSHLQVDNALEIITKNGENHYMIFFSEQRDKIFNKILKYIGIETESKKSLKSSTIFQGKNSHKHANSFYMKYCPSLYIEDHEKEIINLQKSTFEKTRSKSSREIGKLIQNQMHTKSLVDLNSFVNEISELWIKNKISNYDYIMALNYLSGRSLNDLTQYYIFPWILKDFEHNILNWFSSSLYRDLSLPLYANHLNLNDLRRKYEMQDMNDKCFTGTFYSTTAFVGYFLTRQRPFTEIHLEIHGGQFDCPDRLFNGSRELSNLNEKYQELIPALYNLSETYINTNNFFFGKMQKNKVEVKDFNLPIWSKDDPRKFVLILRKILESEKVNKKLNLWIDLIFGYKQSGADAVKSYNLFRNACYELTPEEIEEKLKNNELKGYLYEKQELGYVGKQLFKKGHKKKDNYEEFKEKKNIFFDNSLKLMNMKIEQIKNLNYENYKNKIKFKKINDIFIFYNIYDIQEHLNYNFKGGISSLKSVMNALNKMNKLPHFKKNPLKVKKKLNNHENKKNNFIILGKDCQFLGKNIDNVIKLNKKYIQIIDIKNCIYSCYYLNEISNITCFTTNEKGNKIYIGFENGNIFEYKIINTPIKNENIIYPFMYSIQINVESQLNENIFNLDLFTNENNININNIHNKNNYETQILQKISENNFSINNPHVPEEIVSLKLNEEHDIIIACTLKNLLYIISINNKFKLMHIVDYLYEYPKKIKDIVPLSFNGDFLVYSSLNVYLFNINGVPLCELNLLNKEYNKISKINYVTACFIYDVILFTGHEDGSLIIWKVKNKNMIDNFDQRISYIFNDKISKSFLSEYNYTYDFYYYERKNAYTDKKIRNEYELKRKFDIVSLIKVNDCLETPISFMKMSRNMNYMIILDEKMNIYLLSNFDEYNLDNANSEKKISLKKEKKNTCVWCKRMINNDFFRTTQIKSISNYDINDLICENINENIRNNTDDIYNKIKSNNKDNDFGSDKSKKGTFLCEECKQKLTHTENYLYNY